MKKVLTMVVLAIALAVFLVGALTILLIASDHPRFIFACIGVYVSINFLLSKF
jgi:uncharacterized membrane protein YfcA